MKHSSEDACPAVFEVHRSGEQKPSSENSTEAARFRGGERMETIFREAGVHVGRDWRQDPFLTKRGGEQPGVHGPWSLTPKEKVTCG